MNRRRLTDGMVFKEDMYNNVVEYERLDRY